MAETFQKFLKIPSKHPSDQRPSKIPIRQSEYQICDSSSDLNLFAPEEIDTLLKAIKAFSPGYLYPLIKMYAETGAKTSEVTDLLWKDVDLEKGEVHFEQTIASRERTLKISEEMVELLKKKKATKGLVFLTYYGEAFTKNKIRRAILEFRAKGAFERDWNPTDLRHSFAVNYRKRGGALKELQYLLGHENVYQTKQIYTIKENSHG